MNVTLFRDIKEEDWPSMEIYPDELARHLGKVCSDSDSIRQVSVGPLIPGLKGKYRAASIYSSRLFKYPLVASRKQGDINHIVDHTYAHLTHFLDKRKTIVTCHDLAPLVLRSTLPSRSVGLALWDLALRGMTKAARIIADSENTRRDVIRLTDYPPDRIDVVHAGVGEGFKPIADPDSLESARERLSIPRAYIVLHIGHCGQRKNIEGILIALSKIIEDGYHQVHFVQVGGFFSQNQQRLIEKLGLQSYVTQLNYVPSSDLRFLYNLAKVFVFPSHYEGFGFPPLEAMACGTPVVCSNTSSLPEIVGDAAITVEPSDSAALAAAVERVLGDRQLRAELVANGIARAKMFSWETTARRTFAVYQQVHNEAQ
ncbi:MAG: glycosyltransferase family 4 protein [Chloroflexi bacterium]|nr:glycosyltransferase family 4 protein [Chloroflexota bacterium]